MFYLKSFLLSVCSCAVLSVSAQQTEHMKAMDTGAIPVYTYVEQMPQARYDLGEYLSNHIHYPDSARVHNIEGRVILKFLVKENGHISDCVVFKGVDKDLDEEAVRVVSSMPPWKSGKQNGKPVRVVFTLPISFALEGTDDTAKAAEAPYRNATQMPYADYDVNKYLAANIHYPSEARKARIKGRVLIRMIVNEDGHISDCKVESGIGGGCDEEALRVVAGFPKWNPGRKDGIATKAVMVQPVVFPR